MELLSVIHSSLSRVYVHMEPLGLVCHDQIRQRCIVFLLISLAYLCVIHVKSVKNKRHEADQLIDWTNLPQWQLTHSTCLRRTCLETLCGFPPTYVKLNLLFARPYAVNYAFSGRDEWLTGDRNGNERIKKHFACARVKPDTRKRHTRTVRLKAFTLPRGAVFFFFFFSYDALHVICMTRWNTFFSLPPQTRGLHVCMSTREFLI